MARPEPFDRRTTEILGHTVGVLELLPKERDSEESRRRLRRATADLRLAILQLLMAEAAGHDGTGNRSRPRVPPHPVRETGRL
ncbi:hypothetical protein [Streptomyces sp. NPDC001307]|uniref:hypothetical protein n=1 Tax=Streptomyces sp. NPDC001307 TaxID=3364560 RepID=UPI003676D910